MGRASRKLAMYVLVRRDGRWWLVAGQNTPMKPGRGRGDVVIGVTLGRCVVSAEAEHMGALLPLVRL
jgi:hypothetical protein